jgi:hypothetical protein
MVKWAEAVSKYCDYTNCGAISEPLLSICMN